jgi:hypothetical protein
MPAWARANAITFTGDINPLEMRSGSTITGDVVAVSTADTLTLGGGRSASFDVSQIGSRAQHQAFTTTTTAVTSCSINARTLIVNGAMAR